MRSPIVYSGLIETRFGETDMYGHINSKHFLDYVISSRWTYAEKYLKFTAKELIDKGIGFFLSRSEINYKRPIEAGTVLLITSQVDEVKGPSLYIGFKIVNDSTQKVHADGTLVFAVMDLESMRPKALPDWALQYF